MKKIVITIIIILILIICFGYLLNKNSYFELFSPGVPIKVGILHSLSGTMAISESPVVDATLLAIEEINNNGGLLGRQIVSIVVDGQSDSLTFAKEAEKLIVIDKVSAVFGCWTSASRKTVKPIFERYRHLLFYPVQYEGLEESDNVIYTGAAPNQQLTPAVEWCINNIGKKIFLVGSDYIFPKVGNEIIKDKINVLGGEIVGEEYLLLGSNNVKSIIDKIAETDPDVILNTINGDSNTAFFNELHNAGITSEKIPVMSFSIGESELKDMGLVNMIGNYACWNYFQSINTDENKIFVEKFKNKFGQERVISDPMEAAYIGVYLWAQAVKKAGIVNIKEVRKALKTQRFMAPEGVVYLDPNNNHIWKTVRIGRIREDGQFNILWTSEKNSSTKTLSCK